MKPSPNQSFKRHMSMIVAGFLLAAISSFPTQAQSPGDTASPGEVKGSRSELSRFERLVIEQTNRFRAKRDLQELTPNKTLLKVARYFADYMVRTGKYGHEADGNRPAKRVEQFGYDHCLVAENIAYRATKDSLDDEAAANRFFTAWEDSASHRRNMLDPDFTEIGVALGYDAENDKYYAVQVMGRPKSAEIRFKLVNETSEPVGYRLSNEKDALEIRGRVVRTHYACRPVTLRLNGKATKVMPGAKYVIREEEGEVVLVNE